MRADGQPYAGKRKIRKGVILWFRYPAANYEGAKPRLEWRRLVVEKVEDKEEVPVLPMTIEQDPLLIRGRWLITGTDLEKGERSFYFESMQEVRIVNIREIAESVRPLMVAILRGEEVVRLTEIDDMRASFCRHFNGFGGGTEAVPVPQPFSKATFLASLSRRAE